uniref:Pre-mRNA 3'-end-processing factor FIP1 n=1 Tax=Panagrellus redivivus TaxID=6233 RepID=A0A7E4UW28_PANRE
MDPSPKSPISEDEKIAWPEDDSDGSSSDDEVVVKINNNNTRASTICHVDTSVPPPPIVVPTVTEVAPWRLPGSDIADWFNFGFDERSYMSYLEHKARIESQTFKGPGGQVIFIPPEPKQVSKVEEKPQYVPYLSPYLVTLTDHEPDFMPVVDPKEIEFFLS